MTYEPWNNADPEFQLIIEYYETKLNCYRYGDNIYGNWHIYGYHRMTWENDVHQIHQYLFGWTEQLSAYIGVEIWEMDDDFWSAEHTTKITVPIKRDDIKYGEYTAKFTYDGNDEKLGENELIYVGGAPRISDRSYTPAVSDMNPAGDARITLWW